MRMRPSAILLLSLAWWLAWWLAAPLLIAPNVALAAGHAQPALALADLLRDAGGELCACSMLEAHLLPGCTTGGPLGDGIIPLSPHPSPMNQGG